jgi:endo-1,4-beta-mannosidase
MAAGRNATGAEGSAERWSAEKANAWYAAQPWPVGCNFVPSSAINQIETWQADSFDPKTIDRELGWAESLGFNTVRLFLHDRVWEADRPGFKKRLGEVLDLCKKHQMRAIVTFFTNGCYGFEGEPYLGKQPAPTPGVHNSGWVQSPGAVNVNDPARWGRLEKYVKDVVGTFANDDRVLLWCLYNEPENTKKGAQSR